jgi:hypothetical protein
MRKKFFILGMVLCVSSVCFTGGILAKYTPPVKLPGEIFTGKVDDVQERYGPQGKFQQMTIRDQEGIQTVFVIAPDATVTDKDGNSMSLSWMKGNSVSVRYVIGPDGYTKMIKSVQEV